MDAFALLKADHKRVAHLFEKLAPTNGRAGKLRAEIFAKLNHELNVHTLIEEEILYPAVKNHRQIRHLGFEAVEEHRLVKLLVSELAFMSPESEEWAAKLTVLKECVESHVKEEETDLFPRARQLFSEEELDDIGARLQEEKLRLSADPFALVHSF